MKIGKGGEEEKEDNTTERERKRQISIAEWLTI